MVVPDAGGCSADVGLDAFGVLGPGLVQTDQGMKSVVASEFLSGRYRDRTCDLFRVKEARYQLRQSPVPLVCHSAAYFGAAEVEGAGVPPEHPRRCGLVRDGVAQLSVDDSVDPRNFRFG